MPSSEGLMIMATKGTKTVRRAAMLWVMLLITFVVVWVFVCEPDVSTGTAAALTTVVGMLATVVGLFVKTLERDDERELREVDHDKN